MSKKEIVVISFLAICSAIGCNKEGGGTAPSAAAQQEARDIFSTRCAACHGAEGAGDGPGSAALNPKPRNFKDRSWQSTVTDESLEKIILQGGMAVGKSVAMPPNPDLNEKKEVVAALRLHIRSLGK